MKLGQLLRFISSPAAFVSQGSIADTSVADSPPNTGLWFWRRTPPSHPALDEARADFIEALKDIDSREACCLTMRIRYATTLQALWHFRSNVFLLVSLHRSQREAHARLETLNQHFPTRSPRSGFGALMD